MADRGTMLGRIIGLGGSVVLDRYAKLKGAVVVGKIVLLRRSVKPSADQAAGHTSDGFWLRLPAWGEAGLDVGQGLYDQSGGVSVHLLVFASGWWSQCA